MSQENEQKREKIKKFCGIIYILLLLAVIFYAIMALSDIVYEVSPLLNLSFNIPAIRFGLMGQRGGPLDNIAFVAISWLIYHGIMLAAMLYVRGVFKDLRNGGSPFSKKVGNAAAGLSGAFIGAGLMQGNAVMFFAAALAGLFYFIFDYGRILQEDADTTL
ncbi:MAG: hypothetical protein LBE55_07505 [Clostridiales bacterium]|nr:hypothetical protein [Clostridiales bacterium]